MLEMMYIPVSTGTINATTNRTTTWHIHCQTSWLQSEFTIASHTRLQCSPPCEMLTASDGSIQLPKRRQKMRKTTNRGVQSVMGVNRTFNLGPFLWPSLSIQNTPSFASTQGPIKHSLDQHICTGTLARERTSTSLRIQQSTFTSSAGSSVSAAWWSYGTVTAAICTMTSTNDASEAEHASQWKPV